MNPLRRIADLDTLDVLDGRVIGPAPPCDPPCAGCGKGQNGRLDHEAECQVAYIVRQARPAPSRQTSAVALGVVGIDLGMTGYAAELAADGTATLSRVPVIDAGGKPTYDLPGILALARSWRGRVARVVIEQQGPMPGNGAVGNFSVGYGWGLWRMALTAAGIAFEVVPPLKWKTAMGVAIPRAKPQPRSKARLTKAERKAEAKAKRQRLDARRKSGDARAIERAQGMFPGLDLRATATGKKLSPDKACALLLAAYARRTHGGADD